MRLALAALALLFLLCACGCGQQPPALPVEGLLLVADSPQTLRDWTEAQPADRAAHPGLLEAVVYGQKAFVRAVVTGYAPAADGDDPVTGSLRLKGPDGGVLHTEEVTATPADLKEAAPGVLVLHPGIDILFDPGDSVGTYVLEAELAHGGQHLSLSQPLRVEAGGAFIPAQAEETR